ncbi:MAG: S1 RNA-binding domain-containing protein, partial [Planctomycetota bacterium]
MSSESGSENEDRRVIKIGSQRKGHENVGRPEEKVVVPVPPAPKLPTTDTPAPEAPAPETPTAESPTSATAASPTDAAAASQPAGTQPAATQPAATTPVDSTPAPTEASQAPAAAQPAASPVNESSSTPPPAESTESSTASLDAELKAAPSPPSKPQPISRYSDELDAEVAAALGGMSMNSLMGDGSAATAEPEIDGRYKATVMKLSREEVFFSIQGHYEGMASLRQFDENPEIGSSMDVIVSKFNADQGIYEVRVPGASMSVQDWSDLEEGVTVEATVTGHNTGGLECEVNKIRGFIPVSQISLYRVEDLEQFLGQKFVCVVTEANPARGNLVLSRRATLEREKAESKEKLMKSLEVGQTHEGIVRSLRDFGAFVDIGGVDGLIHISKLSWDRVKHPSEVLEEGQKVKVKIEKIDSETGKIGLSYRDLVADPWQDAAKSFVPNSIVTGTVSKIMDFGAFVRLAAGVEGLVHISELAHHRVVRVANVVSEG